MSLRAQREQIQNTRGTVCVLLRWLCMLWLMSCVAATGGYGYRPRTLKTVRLPPMTLP